jgi:nicotinamidase/pyrazinamidase
VERLVLLEDATSPVPGFEQFQSDFIREMCARGMQVTTTRDFLA